MSLVHGNHTGIECDSDAYQMYDALHQMGIEYELDTNRMYDSFHARFNDRRDMVMSGIHDMLRTSEKSTC